MSADRPGRARDRSARLAELLEWPRGVARLAAASCAACALAVLAYEIPRTINSVGDDAGRNATLSLADLEVAGGNSIVIDQAAAYEARALIPTGDAFRVVTGPNLKHATSLTADAISPWLTYFLMPRRQTGGARWVICYGCDMSRLGSSYRVLWKDDVGISIWTVG
jgi:hypothetical protein